MGNQRNRNRSQRGMALIVAMLAILVLGLLAATVMFTTQGQTLTGASYRQTAQARYAAEAGVQTTMNWLASTNYAAPTVFTSYTMTANPVQYSGNPVVLSANNSVSSNYPDSAVVTAYNSANSQTLPGVANASFSTYATLLRMNANGGGTVSWLPGGGVLQTWQITSVGVVTGVRTSTVTVTQTFERTSSPIFQYGIEAIGTGCGSLTFAGGDYTDSYNSNLGVYGGTNVVAGGNVATNGNAKLGGSGGSAAKINGTIGAPNTNVGGCPDGLTDSNSGNYTALKVVPPMNPPLPWGCSAQPCYPPGTLVTTNQNISSGCAGVAGCTKGSSITIDDGGSNRSVNQYTLAPGSYGNITLDGADVIHVSAGTYNINSINFALDGQIVVDSGPVVFNMVGNCASGCPTEGGLPSGYSSTEIIHGSGFAGFNGCAPSGGTGVVANPNVYGQTTCGPSKSAYSGIPANLQLVYGGTDTMRLGGMPNALVMYAPASSYYTPGAPVGLYGSAIIKNFDDESGSPFHYDTAQASQVVQAGAYKPVGGFSWSKF